MHFFFSIAILQGQAHQEKTCLTSPIPAALCRRTICESELTNELHCMQSHDYHVTPLQVYTVDIANHTAVKEAVYKILRRKETAEFIPHEFTQRVRQCSNLWG